MGADAKTLEKVIYRNGYTRHRAVETFILRKENRGFQIIAHQIDSPDCPPGGKTESV